MVSEAIAGSIQDTQGLKEVRSDIDQNFEFFTEEIFVEEHATVIKLTNVGGTTGIYGNTVFGIYATSTYNSAANQSFVIGNTLAGIIGTSLIGSRSSSATVVKVLNPNNVWQETIRDTTFKDTANTTATWDVTNFRWTFTGSQVIQTSEIYLDSTTITNARLDIATDNITNPANLTYALSADGGSNWETVTLNTSHTFTNIGTDLRLKITSSGNATIDIDATDVTTTIKVYYNE